MTSRKTKDQKAKKAMFQQTLLQEEDRPTCLMEPQVQVTLPPRTARTRAPRSTVAPALLSQGAGEDGAGARRKTTKLQILSEQPRMRETVRMRDRQRELSDKSDSKRDVPQTLQYVVGPETSSDSEDKKKEEKGMIEEEMAEMEGETEASTEEESPTSQTQQILNAMAKMEHRLEYRLNGIEEDIKGMKQDMKRQTNTVNIMKAKVQEIDKEVKDNYEEMVDYKDRVDKIEDSFTGWEQQRNELLQKLDVLENQSRRNNIKIVGLPENIEGYDATEFFQKWIPQSLGLDNMEIERAHRVGRRNQYDGQRPRSVLVKYLRYQDKEKVLKAAIQNAKIHKTPLIVQERRVFFYPDLSSVIVKRRKEFNPAKEIFWNKGYKFTFRYPAVLKVQSAENQSRFFTDCQQALQYANSLPYLKKDQDLMDDYQVQMISPTQVSLPSTSGKEEEVEVEIDQDQVLGL